MADSVVSLLLETLSRLLYQDAHLLDGVVDELRCFHAELSRVSGILRNWEEKGDEKKVTELGRLISDVAYKAEDFIDMLAFNVAKQRRRSGVGKYFLHVFGKSIMPRDAATKIESFTERIKEIENIYGIQSHQVDSGPPLDRCLTNIGADEVDTLVERLTKGDSSQRQIISISGNCGMGKTTLAKKIYHHDSVKDHFKRRVWVQASPNCSAEDLLQKILQGRSGSIDQIYRRNNMRRDEVRKRLSDCLDERYLVVIDDIREVQVWNKVMKAFPDDDNKGSRILLTFRPDGMASVAKSHTSTSYFLRRLDYEERWKLLRKMIFNEAGSCPTVFERLGKKMAEECDGLPLSVMLLGSLLAREKDNKGFWYRVSKDLKEYMSKGGVLSYIHKKLLPDHLSLCFLYLGMFPEGVQIAAKQLIQLWIAEGLIQEKSGKELEDVGEEYLEKLSSLSLIQVAARRADGSVKACRIHDFVRDFCISKGRDKKFHEVQDILNYSPGQKTRRLAIHVTSRVTLSLSNFTNYLGVRSFHFSVQGANYTLPTGSLHLLYGGFKLLKVLNLGMVRVSKVPKELGKLIHLRYLRIKAPDIKHVPASLFNLLNLQTLDMRESYLSSLSSGIWKLEQLRHLHLAELRTLPAVPPQSRSRADGKSLRNLQTLSCIRPDKDTKLLMVKAKFPNVRKLKLASHNRWETAEFLASLDHLYHLHSLKLVSISHLPPDPLAFPVTLTKLTLLRTALPPDSIKMLEKLSNLHTLKLLCNSVRGEKINCSAGGFPQLQFLHLVEIMELKSWTQGGEAMPNLRDLVIKKCVHLTTLPDELWRLETLRQVKLFSPSSDLKDALSQVKPKDGREILVDPPSDNIDDTSTC